MRIAERQADEFSRSIDTLGGRINEADSRLNGGISGSIEKVGVAAAVAAGVGIKSYVDFGKETTKVSTLLDESVMTMDEAEKAIIKMSNATGQSAADVAGAMYDALSSGVSTADSIKFMEQATAVATAGFTDSATSVDVLTTILNSYGMGVEDVTKVSDQLLLTQDKGKVTVGELSNGLGDLVGLAASAGVSLEDVLSAIATLTSNGLKSGSAITSLKAAISNMVKPAEQASEQAKSLGLSFDAQTLNANGLSGMLTNLKSTVGGNTEEMAKLFGSTEALNAMLILSGEGNELYTQTLQGMNDSAGKTSEVLKKVQEADGQKFLDSLNMLENSAVELGKALAPLLNILSFIVRVLAAIPAPVLEMILGLVAAAVAVTKVSQAITGLAGLGGKTGAFFGTMNVGMLKTVGIVLMVVAALVALAAIIAVIIGKGSEISNTMKGVGDSVSNIANGGKTIPAHAKGTKFHPGGLALVGEQGAELLELPRGTRVYNNGDTRKMFSEQGSSGGDTFQINVNVENLKDIEQLMKIARDARRMERMGTVKG